MSRFTRVARSRVSGQHEVGHEGVITGCDVLSLRSSIANPQGVAQSPLRQPHHIACILWYITLIIGINETSANRSFLCESAVKRSGSNIKKT
ncbi:hypothetical protein B1B04_19535 [Lysinibacillus sp. KCTC 33748]|nr:hypothetical protein B1B04_19535 [Lysinibacillus sp. KCTC 33748]